MIMRRKAGNITSECIPEVRRWALIPTNEKLPLVRIGFSGAAHAEVNNCKPVVGNAANFSCDLLRIHQVFYSNFSSPVPWRVFWHHHPLLDHIIEPQTVNETIPLASQCNAITSTALTL